jgi:hypothetical protein
VRPRRLARHRGLGPRGGALPPDGSPTDGFAAYLGQLALGWHFCGPGDPEAKGLVERLQGFIETSFEPGRRFANEVDFQDQLDRWFRERANTRQHRAIRAVPAERLRQELPRCAGRPSGCQTPTAAP